MIVWEIVWSVYAKNDGCESRVMRGGGEWLPVMITCLQLRQQIDANVGRHYIKGFAFNWRRCLGYTCLKLDDRPIQAKDLHFIISPDLTSLVITSGHGS